MSAPQPAPLLHSGRTGLFLPLYHLEIMYFFPIKYLNSSARTASEITRPAGSSSARSGASQLVWMPLAADAPSRGMVSVGNGGNHRIIES